MKGGRERETHPSRCAKISKGTIGASRSVSAPGWWLAVTYISRAGDEANFRSVISDEHLSLLGLARIARPIAPCVPALPSHMLGDSG